MTVLAGAAAWPLVARAQQKAMPVIGILGAALPESKQVQLNLAAFRQGLGEFGYVEGQNVAIEYRWAEGHFDRLPALAADLVGRKVDVIVTEGGDSTTLAAKNATSTIPVVFHTSSDPVAKGLVASLARPGSNLTGVSLMSAELLPKLLELLLELVPQAKLIAVLVDPSIPRDVVAAALAKGVQLHILKAVSEGEIDAAFATLVELQAGGLIVDTLNRGLHRGAGITPRRPGDRSIPRFSRRWRPAQLWTEHDGRLSREGHLYREDPQGREARRSAGPATH